MLKILREAYFELGILYPTKLSFKCDYKIKTFSYTQSLKGFTIHRFGENYIRKKVLQEIQKEDTGRKSRNYEECHEINLRTEAVQQV